jgi:RNA polymerase sigma-70 factor (ECF subfamily)
MVDVDIGVDWHAVDERLDARAMRGELNLALASLTPSEREAFLLVVWEGLSAPEAAEVLGVTPTVVRTRLTRARQRARTILSAAPLPAV